jgi:hypothetical protein
MRIGVGVKLDRRIREVQEDWTAEQRQDEYMSLLAHTDEDALDEGEMLTLAALCIVFLGG